MYLDDTLYHLYVLPSVGDLYVHADLHGASSVIIKNPAGRCHRRSCGISILFEIPSALVITRCSESTTPNRVISEARCS